MWNLREPWFEALPPVLPQAAGVHPAQQLALLGPGAEEAPRAQLVIASSPGAEVGVHQGLAMLSCQMLIFTEHLEGVYIIFGSMGGRENIPGLSDQTGL